MIRPLWILSALTLAASLATPYALLAQSAPPAPVAPNSPPTSAPAPPAATTPPAPTAPPKAPEAPRRGTRPGDVQKVFVVKHVRVSEMARLLSVFPAEISVSLDLNLRAVAVSAAPAVVAAIEETIRRLDVPAPPGINVLITAYVIEALAQPGPQTNMPPELADCVTQLKQMFGYADYRLADTVIARGSDGEMVTSGGMSKRDKTSPPIFFSLRARVSVSRDTSPALIRLGEFAFGNNASVNAEEGPYKGVKLLGDIELRDGQYVVVGKSAIGDSGNAQILVLSAKIAD